MKTVNVNEYRGNIKKYLDIAEAEKLVIHKSKGCSFVILPLENQEEEPFLSDAQKKAIDQALDQVAQGKVDIHDQAMSQIKTKFPKYFK